MKLLVPDSTDHEPGKEDSAEDKVWSDMFEAVDKSADGILSRDELWKFIKSIDCPIMKAMTVEDFETNVYSRCLQPNRGALNDTFTLNDFVEMMEDYTMKVFFYEADLDGDGIVTFEEVIKTCVNKGLEIGYSETAAIKMLFDSESNNLLDLGRIKDMIKKSELAPGMASMPGSNHEHYVTSWEL